MATVTFDHITKAYADGTIAVNDLDLLIKDGEFLVLVGPSGCGKTTALRCLAGLEEITSGQIKIDARVVNRVPSKDRNIAMVFQSYALYPHMTVFDNMSFALKLAKVDVAVRKEKVERAAKILNLTPYLERTPKELSGGQRQRVAIGRSIVRAPKVFLFDEPLSNLDAALRGQTRVEIASLHRSLGATTIYVTHDQVEAMTLADRVVVLRDGLIEQVGSPLELYDHPANQFVAQFIGTPQMNVVAAQAFPELAQLAGARVPADGAVGVRPEGVRMLPVGQGVAAKVTLVESLGNDTLIHTVLASGVAMVARQSERSTLQPGDAVGLAIDANALHVFDAQGRALTALPRAA
jgi:multiple sugar transport system ATP-binding protein